MQPASFALVDAALLLPSSSLAPPFALSLSFSFALSSLADPDDCASRRGCASGRRCAMSGVPGHAQSFGVALNALCAQSERRALLHERDCNCGCELRASLRCGWCGEWYAPGC